jgi:hypothetical protein
MSNHYGYSTLAMQSLEKAGYKVTVADGCIPGLWNVQGLASDVTTNQLLDLADSHGVHPLSIPSPFARNSMP